MACVILASADGEPSGDHVAIGIKIISSAADLLGSLRNSTRVRRGRDTEIIVVAVDLYDAGQDLALTLFALRIACEVLFPLVGKEAGFQVAFGIKEI